MTPAAPPAQSYTGVDYALVSLQQTSAQIEMWFRIHRDNLYLDGRKTQGTKAGYLRKVWLYHTQVAHEVPEADIEKALGLAHNTLQPIREWIQDERQRLPWLDEWLDARTDEIRAAVEFSTTVDAYLNDAWIGSERRMLAPPARTLRGPDTREDHRAVRSLADDERVARAVIEDDFERAEATRARRGAAARIVAERKGPGG